MLKCFWGFLQVAKYLQQHGQIQYAREMYKKMGDVKSVVTLYVEAQVTTSIICIIERNLSDLGNWMVPKSDLDIPTQTFTLYNFKKIFKF
jgi:hypothetical protein